MIWHSQNICEGESLVMKYWMVQNNIYEEKSYQEVFLICICIEKHEYFINCECIWTCKYLLPL